jgi:hypothetical protein
MSSCRPLTGWRHPDAEALYHAILASPTNIDIFTRMDRDTSVDAGFFAGITSELHIPPRQTLGILLKMHSSLLIEVLPTPVGIIVNKNNTAPTVPTQMTVTHNNINKSSLATFTTNFLVIFLQSYRTRVFQMTYIMTDKAN